jgi:hypothetical protein
MDQRARTARDIQTAIGRVLLTRWDPIGVADVPEASGECDAYVGPICRLLASGASDDEIAQHLGGVETTAMGIEGSDWRMLIPVAHELRMVFRRLSAVPPAT